MRPDEPIPHFEATCPNCPWSRLCGPEEIIRLMRAAGRLKRTSDLSLEMLAELFQSSADRLRCPDCGQRGLELRGRSDLDRGWPGQAPCEACGKGIPQERLALYPGATLCAACQERVDRGEPVGQTEYCPRCGCPMRLRQRRGEGLARYEMVCTNTPPCRLGGGW